MIGQPFKFPLRRLRRPEESMFAYRRNLLAEEAREAIGEIEDAKTKRALAALFNLIVESGNA